MREALVSWISVWLPQWDHRLRVLRLSAVANRMRRTYDGFNGRIQTRIHGFPAVMNGGNPYPFIVSTFPLFNRALVELALQQGRDAGRKLVVIDIGASLGNTVLLLQDQAGASIDSIHCVEGDPEFAELLEINAARFSNVVIHLAMLSREPGRIAALVRQHPGTATASGAGKVDATTADSLLLPAAPRFDLLKVDIDGSDGEALTGASRLLRRDQPTVIFEWHPALALKAGNDPRAAFAALSQAGYRRLLWFRNTGEFSHFGSVDDREIETWEKYLVAMETHADPHFDVIALPGRLEHLAFGIASFGKL